MSMVPQPDGLAEAVKRAKELAARMIPASGLSVNGGNEDANSRKRPLDGGHSGVDDGPQVKKPTIDPADFTQFGATDAQAIAQAAIAKVGAQLGLTQMITIEIKIPNRMVGLVIGRQGEMINRLQADSGARIQVAPDGSEIAGERNVTICGTPDTVERAKALVNKVVEDAGGVVTMPGPGTGIMSMPMVANLDQGQEVVEMMIPANKVGLVIGKGGEMIKALQERAGCKMQMIQDGQFANAPEKPLRMTGMPENCKKAREFVMHLIEQKELEGYGGPPSQYNMAGYIARGLTGDLDLTRGMPQTIEVHVPKPLVGFVIGRNGEHINNVQNTCGVRLQFQNDIPDTDFRIATISGTVESCQRAKKMVEDIVAERQTMGYKPRLDLPNPIGPGVQTVQLTIPGNKCGLVIGKGGETIRQLQMQSGAHIELHRGAQPNPHEKLFNIRGTPQQVEHAQQLIRQKCDMMGGPGPFPGQQVPGMPYPGGQMYSPQQAAVYAGQGASPWAQYPFQQAYAQQGADPSHQAAWAAYYQQVYAAQAQAQAQAQAGQQQGQQPQGQAGTQSAQDVQAQWAEYYRQLGNLGYAYYGQQGQQPPSSGGGPPSSGSAEPK